MKHFLVYAILVVLGLSLALHVFMKGTYQAHPLGSGMVLVCDTRTGHIWIHGPGGVVVDMGTHWWPRCKLYEPVGTKH